MTSMTLSSKAPTRVFIVLTALLGLAAPHLTAAERSNINITGYVINAQLDPAQHTMKATARVTFTATDTVSSAIFELHNALKVDSVTDGHNSAQRRTRPQCNRSASPCQTP